MANPIPKRISKEIERLLKDPVPGIDAIPHEDNLRYFSVVMDGPSQSPYEGGHFKLELFLPEEYPMGPPKVRFLTKLYHPNTDKLGRICLDILKDPVPGIDAIPHEDNLRYFSVVMDGPSQSPYEGGHFKLELFLPEEYPMGPPKVRFLTKLYHPNTDKLGRICLDILKDRWSPALQIRTVLLSIQALLSAPNPDDPLANDVADHWKKNEKEAILTEKPFEKLLELLYYPSYYKSQFDFLGIQLPKGLLLYGPPGVGKTFLIKQAAKFCKISVVSVNSSDIITSYTGESEKNLRDKFAQAEDISIKTNRPSILFIDEIDALAPKRDDTLQLESRLVSQLLTLLDGLLSRKNVIVIGATNRPNSIDPALRRPGRLEREISIEVPNFSDRKKIILHYLNAFYSSDPSLQPLAVSNSNIVMGLDIDELCHSTHGFVGADLAALFREAGLNAIKSKYSLSAETSAFDTIIQDKKISLSKSDFAFALTRVVPSIKRSFVIDIPKMSWDDIGGLESVKKEIIKAVEWPLKYSKQMARLGAAPPSGILLYGPPGCSKTCLAKIIASSYSLSCSFFSVNSAELFSSYVGDSEYFLRNLFTKARQSCPSVIFFDEIDVIVGRRQVDSSNGGSNDEVQARVLSTLLNEMDGIERFSSILVVAATNRPDMIDDALLRPGRFDKLIYVPPPDFLGRKHIFEIKLKNSPTSLTESDIAVLAEKTENFSGADITNLCQEAALIALRSDKLNTIVKNMGNFGLL
ncbi:hypothetical protein BB561_005287 [Smittium simulii]|uniref:UBC core domain-containing protein n=1 Tax=Smittium simulii TaxID=133385 RepID=A0A2T9YB57_9FUNG|nr:hypothetical protein BB561_005287 [Smittium simulii]